LSKFLDYSQVSFNIAMLAGDNENTPKQKVNFLIFKFKNHENKSFNMKYLLSLLALIIVISCSVDDGSIGSDINSENDSKSIQLRRSFEPCAPEHVDLVKRYLKDYKGNPPEIYFNEKIIEVFDEQLPIEKAKLESQGFETYANNLENANVFSEATKNLLSDISTYVESKTDEELQNTDLKQYFINEYNDENIKSIDPFYCYVYNVILEVFTEYQDGDLEFRGGCEFKQFFKDVVDGIKTGAVIGGVIGSVVDTTVFGLTFAAAGGIIGGTVGIIYGIFNWGDDCDCGKVTSLNIKSDDNCDLTRTIIAVGAGADVGGFKWTVLQNGQTVSFTTVAQYLDVTQVNPSEPMKICVRSICPDGEEKETCSDFDLNVVDTNNPLGQVGELVIDGTCAVEENAGNGNPYNCFMTGEVNMFYWYSSNDGSGNISYSYTLTPTDLYQVVSEDEKSIEVVWVDTGNATLVVTATNICTGDETSKSLDIYIPF